MAKEIQVKYAAGRTVYATIFNSVGLVWNTASAAFEAYATANVTDYDVSLTQQGSASGLYFGDFPSAITAGVYSIVAKEQIAGAPAESDPAVALGDIQWSGTATIPLASLASSGQVSQFAPIRLARGTMINNFPFKLVSAADHITPFTSGVVSGQISRDGAAFGALQSGAITEVGLGWYSTNLTSGDLLANTAALVFTARGISGGTSDQRDFAFVLQRVSGII